MRVMILSLKDEHAELILSGQRGYYVRSTSTFHRGSIGLYGYIPVSRPRKMWKRALLGFECATVQVFHHDE